MPDLVHLLITLLAVGLITWLALWILQQFPLPDPLGRVIRVVIIVVAVLIVIGVLLNLGGYRVLP
jgi:hypothetical protein